MKHGVLTITVPKKRDTDQSTGHIPVTEETESANQSGDSRSGKGGSGSGARASSGSGSAANATGGSTGSSAGSGGFNANVETAGLPSASAHPTATATA
jgi:hypothetical protein